MYILAVVLQPSSDSNKYKKWFAVFKQLVIWNKNEPLQNQDSRRAVI